MVVEGVSRINYFVFVKCQFQVSNMWLEDPARVGVFFEVAEYARKGNT